MSGRDRLPDGEFHTRVESKADLILLAGVKIHQSVDVAGAQVTERRLHCRRHEVLARWNEVNGFSEIR